VTSVIPSRCEANCISKLYIIGAGFDCRKGNGRQNEVARGRSRSHFTVCIDDRRDSTSKMRGEAERP
jgi:hypothetical protein